MSTYFPRAILDSLSTCIGVLEPDGTLVDANTALLSAAGVSLQRVYGTKFWDCYGWNYSEDVRVRVREACEAAARGETVRFDAPVRVAGGDTKIIDWQITALRDDSGGITHLISSAVDITPKREAELTRLASERDQARGLLERIVRHAPVGIAVLEGEDLRFTLANPAMEAVLGPHAQLLGRTYRKMFPNAAAAGAEEALLDVLHTGEPWQAHEFETAIDDGRRLTYWDVVGLPLPGVHPGSVLVLAWEVTERRVSRRALLESEARFRLMADGLPLIIWVHDAEGQQEFVNHTFGEFFGVQPEEMHGNRWAQLMHPEDAEAYIEEFRACAQARRPFHADVRVRRADGAWRWIESWGRPRLAPDGSFMGFVGASADITDRRCAEDALRQSEARYRDLVQNANSAIIRWNRSRTITFFNEHAEKLFGYRAEEMLGRDISVLVPQRETGGRDLSGLVDDVAAHPEKYTEFTHENVCRDGRRVWMLWTNRAIRDESGALKEIQAVGTDITQLKAAEDALREADRRKDEFLAMLAHELRNPLAAISNAVHVARLQPDSPERVAWGLNTAERQIAHLVHLVNELLDVARIATGRLKLRRTDAELGAVVQDVIESWRERFASHRLDFVAELPEQPIPVEVDVDRLTQTLNNLLDNAAKYTDEGGQVRLSVRRNGAEAVISVADTGVGLAPEEVSRIFEIFEQGRSGDGRTDGGLGLGLHLVKCLVEKHGGIVEAHSAGRGHGTEFVVRLPVSSTPRNPQLASTRALHALEPRRILIVEDSQDVADSLRAVLEAIGYEVTVARDGTQALALVQELNPDVALVDIGLPDMTGYELAKHLRAQSTNRRPRLVALTGYGRPEDRQEAKNAGFDAHLTKPASLETLADVLSG